MNWYKKAQTNYPYSLLEIIRMQENGLSLSTMSFDELKEAKELEKNGFINKEIKQDTSGKYAVYVINKDKFKQMGWSTEIGSKFRIKS